MMKQDNPQVSIQQLNINSSLPITDIFEPFEGNQWAMLLDSANSDHQDARFDIFVAEPLATISATGKVSTIQEIGSEPIITSDNNPLALLQALYDDYFPNKIEFENNHKLPFIAGALGYFGYDLGRQFETILEQGTEQKSEKKAREYNTPDMAVGLYTWSVIKDRQTQRFYLCALNNYPHPSASQIENSLIKDQPSKFSLTTPWQSNMSQVEYHQKIAQIHQYLADGDCYQINLAQRFTASYQGNEWHAYKKLRVSNQAPFSAFIRLPDTAILSISPERFISVNGSSVQTKPIKGTRPRSDNPAQDQKNIDALLCSEKDKAENLMIVDLLRNDLSKHCQAGSLKVPELFKIESFKAVHHLVSTVTGQLNPNSSALDLLQGAFPGGSITGAPKIRAMQIIDELEPNNRNIYCGSIGYIGIQGDMDTSICIRTLLCEQRDSSKNIYCWAGGGIVIDSMANDEYQESLDKVSKILPEL
jgi:para-aminobenzoate synthetase component 1